ncbi:hypothetical protein [Streptomyces sp. NPDC090083]|uniref:hypothetical protein n=1 Tax=Streptomyces sp. NPDC090083 TaxID=3365941 RepID=UPI0037FCB2C6
MDEPVLSCLLVARHLLPTLAVPVLYCATMAADVRCPGHRLALRPHRGPRAGSAAWS